MTPRYKAERWVAYAHRVSLIFGIVFAVGAALMVVLVLVVPFARPERLWYALGMVAAALPMWLIAWLLKQAQNRPW